MIYLDVNKLNWDSLRLKWLLQREREGYDDESLDHFEEFFDKWVTPILLKKKQGLLTDVIELQDNSIISTLLKLLDTFCIPENGINFAEKEKDELFWIKYEKWFVFCVIWSLGSTLQEDSRKMFDQIIREIEDTFPLSQTVYDCYLNKEKNEFVKWDERLSIAPASWKPKENMPNHRFLVETVDTIRARYMIDKSLKSRIPILAIGVTGTGKTSIINSIMSELDDNVYSYNIINLSGQTTSKKLQQIVEAKLNRSTKKKFRPFNGKKGLIFIDDLNMPKQDEFAAQPPLELIRQFMEYGGWYDRAMLDIFVEIIDTDIIAAMGPPGGGRNQISKRISSKFQIMNFPTPNDLQIKRIFSSILNYSTAGFDSEEVRVHIDKVSEFIIELYTAI